MILAHAEVCPICNGSGRVKSENPDSFEKTRTCHGCGGKGWVVVQDTYYGPSPREPKYPPENPWFPEYDPYWWMHRWYC